MAEGLTLFGFHHSVYTCIVRMALIETGLTATYVETDPFATPPDPVLSRVTLLGRVPVLQHGDFVLTETAAILHYLDQIATGPSLIPSDPKAAACMAQVIGIVDAYGYCQMVRKIFVHGFYNAHIGELADPARVQAGLAAAQPTLSALEQIASEGRVLGGGKITLADIHLAPMMAYFLTVPVASACLLNHSALSLWWTDLRQRPSLLAIDPFKAA